MGRHEVNGAQQRERKALSQEFPLCVNVTMGEAEVCVSPKELSAVFGTGRPKKEWFIHLWLMVLPGFNLPVKLLIQGQDSVTKHLLSRCHTTVLLPERFIAQEIKAAVELFSLQTWKQDLWKTLKKPNKRPFF